jgi:hypothetical protein
VAIPAELEFRLKEARKLDSAEVSPTKGIELMGPNE